MSSDHEISSSDDQVDEESSVFTTVDDGLPEPEERNPLTVDDILCEATDRGDAETVKRALQNGANVNSVRHHRTLLMMACEHGYDEIVGILVDAGADARWKGSGGRSAIHVACFEWHLSTVRLLINHDNGLLEIVDDLGWTPLFVAVEQQHSDMVRFLLDSGADPHHHATRSGETALLYACRRDNLEIVRPLLAAGVDVAARNENQQTALHFAVHSGGIETMLELILQHNANMFAVDGNGRTPFDWAQWEREAAIDSLLEMYGNKLTRDHGSFALHELLKVAEYSFAFAKTKTFHPPLNPLRIILPLGQLTLTHLRTLLNASHPELLRNRDDKGKLPIHIVCQTDAPVEVLSMLVEIDSAMLQIADNHSGSLPIHSCCSGVADYASMRYLVEQGGVGTLCARNHEGALPLHVLCGSTNPSWQTVQYLIQSFPGSVAMRTNAGEYPFMVAASNSSASLSVVYELVRANPGLVVPS